MRYLIHIKKMLIVDQDIFDIISLVVTAVLSMFFSWYVVTLYNGYNFYVADAGIFYHTEYIFYHTHMLLSWPSSNHLINPVPYGNLIYIIIAPLLLFQDSPAIFLIFEMVWVLLGSFFLFKIARHETGSVFWAFSLQSIYILFPPNYAIVTNGPEFEILLPTFVLISYYLFIKGKYAASVVVGLLGATTSIVSPVIIVIFFLIEDFEIKGYVYKLLKRTLRMKNTEKETIVYPYKYAFILLWVGIAIFVALLFIKTPIHSLIPSFFSTNSFTSGTSHSHNTFGSFFDRIISSDDTKLIFFYQILGGFLFLPLVSPFVIPIISYFLVIFYANYDAYYNPLNHYTSIIIAFLFLGMVYNVRDVKLNKNKLRKLMIALIVAMLLSFMLYSPFSITNIENGTVHSEYSVTSEDQYLNVAFSVIPHNASVFSQNAFPQLMNRLNFYMPGYYNNQTVDYAVVSPISPATYLPNFIGFSPFWAQHFLNNTSYGIFEFVGGVTVFKLNYHSGPILFIPLVMKYTININLTSGISLNAPVYKGIYEYMPPGIYKFTYAIKVNGNLPTNSPLEFLEQTWNSNGKVLPAESTDIENLQEKNGYLVYTVMQNLTSYEVEYQPNLFLVENHGILNISVEIVSLEMVSMTVQEG